MTRQIVAAIGSDAASARAQISALGPSLEGGPAPSVGEVLTWDGTAWVPAAGGGGGGVASVSADSPLASSGGLNPAISLSAGTSIGDFIRWDGSTWAVYSPPAPVTPVTSVSASSPLASSGGTTPDISLDAGASAGDLLTWDGTAWAGASPAAGYWSKSVTELSPLTAGDTVAVEIGAGTAGVTVTDTLASVSSEVRPGFVSLADNVKLAELSATGASLLLQGDSGDIIPVIPALVARDFDTSPTTLDLQIGGLTLNAAAGAAGEVLTSNGSGAAPTWQAGGGGSISALTGDVTASGPGSAAATVIALQGHSVSTTAPTSNQILQWISGTSKWTPTANGVGLGSKVLLVVEGGAYATIQDAIDAAVDNDVILVGPKASGASWGPAAFSPGKRLVVAALGSKWSTQVRVDSLTFNVSSGLNVLLNTVFVRGLYVNSSFTALAPGVNFYGTFPGRLRLQECFIYNNNAATGTGVVSNNSGSGSSLYIDNCIIQSGWSTGIGVDHQQGYTSIRGGSEISRYQYALQCAGVAPASTVEIVNTLLDNTGATLNTSEVIRMTGGLVTCGYSTIKNTNANASGVNLTAAGATFGAGDATFAIATGTGFCVTGVPGAFFLYGHVSYSHSSLVAYNVRVKTTGGITPVATTQAYTAV